MQVTSRTPDPDPANNRATDTTQVPPTTVTSTPRPPRGIPGDEVGTSNGSAFREGAVLAPLRTNADQSYERRPGGTDGSTVDSNNNRADFRLLTPSDPQNRAGGR